MSYPSLSPDVRPRTRRRALALTASAVAGALAVAAAGAALPASAAVDPAAQIVISEVYGGGGNSGAELTHDFVELYNTTDADVDVAGWTLQYGSAEGAFSSSTTLAGSVPAGGYFLVELAQGSGGSIPLPAPDATGSLALGGSAGKVALASDANVVTGPADAAVVDFVAYGPNATPFAGSGPAPATSSTTSVSRNLSNTHTADNAADFTAGVPTPANSGRAEPDPEPEPSEPTPAEPAVVSIAEIQGTGDSSPLAGTLVTTEGVVTAHYPSGGLDGYVLQTAGTGGALDLATHDASDAVFVYAPGGAAAEVSLGASVRITGTVGENFGQTQVTVAPGGAEPIDALAAPVPATVGWPSDTAEREALESMLLLPQGGFTVSDTYATNQYGEVGLAAGATPLRQPTDAARPGSPEAAAVAADNAARGVVLDDGSSTDFLSAANSGLTPPYVSLTEPVVVGGSVTFDAPVVVAYGFDEWRFQPTTPVIGDGSGTDGVTFSSPRTDAPEPVGGDVSVASFNVLNYFTTLGTADASCVAYPDRTGDGNNVREGCAQRGAWDADDFARQQSKIVDAISALDASVVGLMEIENSAALGEAADEAVSTLVAALNSAAGTQKWAFVPSSSELPDPATQDVITNAIIYQPALVEPVGASRALGDLSDDGEPFSNAREPIGQVFAPAADGEDFLFVVNHFKSKGSPTYPEDADAGDGQGAANWSRVRQAEALRDWVADVQGDTEAVILAGDFNSYGQEDPLQVLYTAGYTDAEAAFDLGESSYSFSGLSGSLDHVLLNGAALERAAGADIWNINSGESVALEYSRYNSHGTLFWEEGPYRASDHDPVKVGLAADELPVELTLFGINDFHGRISPVTPAEGEDPENPGTVGFAGTLEELRAGARGPSLFLSAGDNIGASLFASSIAQDQPTIDVLNALGLQATAVGNHEFDRGFDDLSGRVTDESDYPQLGANVYAAGTEEPVLPEYALLPAGDLVVGVIGAVTEETSSLVSPAGIEGLDFGDPVAAVNRVSAQLSDGDASNGEADVIVALYHEGASDVVEGDSLDALVSEGGAFASIVEDTSADVDAIYTGHTHQEYAWSAPIPGTDRTRPIVQTGSYGSNIGTVTLLIDAETGELVGHTQENVPVTTTPAADLISTYPRVAEVDEIVRAAVAAADEVGNTPVGTVSDDITTAFSGGSFVDGIYTGGQRDDRASESALGNLVAESIRDSLAELPDGAQIGVTNPGGLRAELYDTQAEFGDTAVPGLADGEISYSQALAVLPFNNTMALVTLTGAQFESLLEQQWQRTADGAVPSRPYLQLGLSDNVSYTFDETRAEGDRITSVTVDGVALDPAAEYRIGTLSFLAVGGDNFRAFTEGSDYVDTGLLDYEAWVDYLTASSPVPAPYAKHAVSVQGVPDAVAPGSSVALRVSELDLTSLGTPETTELTVTVGGQPAGTVPVSGGAADVSVNVPADAPLGALDVVLTSEVTGTTVTVPLRVATPTGPGTTPAGPGQPGSAADAGGTGPGGLPLTGSELPWGLALGAAFLLVVGTMAVALRPRRTTGVRGPVD